MSTRVRVGYILILTVVLSVMVAILITKSHLYHFLETTSTDQEWHIIKEAIRTLMLFWAIVFTFLYIGCTKGNSINLSIHWVNKRQ